MTGVPRSGGRRSGLAAIAAAVMATAAGSPAAVGTPPPPRTAAAPRQTEVPWSVGERLEYRVKFGIFNVGRATMAVLGIDTIRGEPCYHVLFTVRGHALMYSLRDSLQSWFGVNDLVSRRFNQDADENGKQRVRHHEILAEQGIWVKNDVDTGATVSDPLDDASFFYYARTLPLEADSTYTVPRYFVAEKNPVTIRVLGRQSIGVPAGDFDAVVVRPVFRSGGMFSDRGQAAIWFSDDAARVPLRIRASTGIGTLDISLTSATDAWRGRR